MPAHEIGDLRKRVHDLEETRRLAENLSQVQTVNETLRQIADWCARLCDADFVSILLLHYFKALIISIKHHQMFPK